MSEQLNAPAGWLPEPYGSAGQHSWAEYVRAVAGRDSGREVALKTGSSESAISRWKSGYSVPDPRQVVTIARAYNRNPVEALIAAGYLTADEASIPMTQPSLRDFSDLELAREMLRRAAAAE
ncbi:helix-turn-helix domain-containing protein [Agromyces aurantiacus]|uniref:Helix-turn-helix domain-containing protein n=1 Tax=Agromyces aurantiacus TaxID=165814 RepID=A0ABV9R8C6_9MICO|nr:helix-turn-helix transcriptional regulator [Agromyces aurantiacus]MBM7504220.1 transcriptional regulator with XRE-family HTH domain [Agromyces aurantiacus]